MDDFYVPFGRMVNFQTRKGKFDLLSDVFEDAKERAQEGLDRFLSNFEMKNKSFSEKLSFLQFEKTELIMLKYRK